MQVEDVGSGVLALEVVGGGDLLGRRDVGVGGVDGDAVLLLEGGLDLAVVGPVVGKGDDVELTLGLGGLDECVESAEVGSARGDGCVDVRRRGVGRACAGTEGDRRCGEDRKAGEGALVEQGFLLVAAGRPRCERAGIPDAFVKNTAAGVSAGGSEVNEGRTRAVG